MPETADRIEAAAHSIYAALEGPIADQDFGRQKRQWELSLRLARAAEPALRSPVEVELRKTIAFLEDQLLTADNALIAIRDITGQTHTGKPRVYTALSQIDQLARKALA